MKQVQVTPAKAKLVDASKLTDAIDEELRKAGTVSFLVLKDPLHDSHGNEVSSYPHPETRVPVPVLVDKAISTPFALRP